MTTSTVEPGAPAVSDGSDREIRLSRLIHAPRDLVFRAFITPEQVGAWWGPRGFTTTTRQMDVRPGGLWLFTMHGPDGKDWPNHALYHVVQPPERLEYSHGAGDPSQPPAFEVTITFDEEEGGTLVTLLTVFPSAEARDFVVREVNAIEGGKQTLERLGEFMQAMRQG